MTDIEIDIAVEDGRWQAALPDLDGLVQAAVAAGVAILPGAPPPPLEVSVVLADDARLRALNRTWRGRDAATNVLSFPAARQPPRPGAPVFLGDLVLAYDTVLRESEEPPKPLAHHVVHLLVHGTLHLLGQDHETGEAQAEAMEALETAALAGLGIPDPYAG